MGGGSSPRHRKSFRVYAITIHHSADTFSIVHPNVLNNAEVPGARPSTTALAFPDCVSQKREHVERKSINRAFASSNLAIPGARLYSFLTRSIEGNLFVRYHIIACLSK